MSNITFAELEPSKCLDARALKAVSGGAGGWLWGWISPYQRGVGTEPAVSLYNPVFNIQYANQTIVGGDAPIFAINAPVLAPTTTITETNLAASISQTTLAAIASGFSAAKT